MPATKGHLDFFETAIANEYLCQNYAFEMPVPLLTLQRRQQQCRCVCGEVMGMQTDLTTIDVALGAAIDAVSGDIPGRKITTSLVGEVAESMKYAYPQDPTHSVSAIKRFDESAIAQQVREP